MFTPPPPLSVRAPALVPPQERPGALPAASPTSASGLAASSPSPPPESTSAAVMTIDEDRPAAGLVTAEPAPVAAAVGEVAPAVEVEAPAAPTSAVRPPSLDLNEDDGGAQCPICLRPLLEQQACALRCGHIYHAECFGSWSAQKERGECPQCKLVTNANELRMLAFEMDEVIDASLEEVLRIEAWTDEQRARWEEELAIECARAREELNNAESEADRCRSSAQDLKRQRLDVVVPETKEKEAALAPLSQQLNQRSFECTKLRQQLDAFSTCQQKRLPIPQVQEGDEDYVEEKKKLRVTRPESRATLLHEALVHNRQLEENMRKQLNENVCAADNVDQELKKKRQQDSRLRRQLSERQSEVLERQSSQASSSSAPARQQSQISSSVLGQQKQHHQQGHESSSSQGAAAGAAQAVASGSAMSGGSLRDGAAPSSSGSGGDRAVGEVIGAGGGGGAVGDHAARGAKMMALPASASVASSSSGRPLSRGGGAGAAAPSVVAPEDDADFLYGGPARKPAAAASGLKQLLAAAGKSASGRVASSPASAMVVTRGGGKPTQMRKLFAGMKA